MNPVLFMAGRLRDLSDLDLTGITVVDVASALAKINRFVGHTEHPYSVAQHAVLVSALAPLNQAYEALHHDDTEAFVGDVAGPIKTGLPEFRALEFAVKRKLAPWLGLAIYEPEQVRQADAHALRLEQWHLQGQWLSVKPDRADEPELKALLQPIPWTVARDLYMWQHCRLMP